jgi:hypothetical protein
MQVGIFFICKRVRHFDYDYTATQHCHTSLDSVQAEAQLTFNSSSSLQLRLRGNSTKVSERPVVLWTFFAPIDVKNTLRNFGQCVVEHSVL